MVPFWPRRIPNLDKYITNLYEGVSPVFLYTKLLLKKTLQYNKWNLQWNVFIPSPHPSKCIFDFTNCMINNYVYI